MASMEVPPRMSERCLGPLYAERFAPALEVRLARLVDLHHRSSTSYQIC
jgi:hypothetical protein